MLVAVKEVCTLYIVEWFYQISISYRKKKSKKKIE